MRTGYFRVTDQELEDGIKFHPKAVITGVSLKSPYFADCIFLVASPDLTDEVSYDPADSIRLQGKQVVVLRLILGRNEDGELEYLGWVADEINAKRKE
jgi:hypothetical protein